MLLALVLAATLTPTPEPSPVPLVCAEGTVPGWLGEDGLPTSCVSNNPCPEVESGPCPGDLPTEIPVVVLVPTEAPVAPEAPPAYVPVLTVPEVTNAPEALADAGLAPVPAPTLAETGPNEDQALLVAILLLALGTVLVAWALVFSEGKLASNSLLRNAERARAKGHNADDLECIYYRGDYAGIDLAGTCPLCNPTEDRRSRWFR